jgi:hypothetical protein
VLPGIEEAELARVPPRILGHARSGAHEMPSFLLHGGVGEGVLGRSFDDLVFAIRPTHVEGARNGEGMEALEELRGEPVVARAARKVSGP